MNQPRTEGLTAAEGAWAPEKSLRMRVHAAAAIGLALLFVPAPAWACPVCGMVGTADNAWAYTVMSVMLTVLPLGMIGGAVYWVSRRVAAHEAWTEAGTASRAMADASRIAIGVHTVHLRAAADAADRPARGSTADAATSQGQSAPLLTATPNCDVRNTH